MAAGRFAEIEFSRVASLCLQRSRKTFLNEALKGTCTLDETGNRHPDDADRVAARQHLRDALAKKSVNGKQLMPHEVAKKCMGALLSTLEGDLMDAQWASMREGVRQAMTTAAAAREEAVREAAGEGAGLADLAALKAALPKAIDLGKLVALVDVSGSMSGQPMEAAIGLGMLVSELSAPAFRDRVLTFESRPQWVNLSGCAKVADKVRQLQRVPWGGSTDFETAVSRSCRRRSGRRSVRTRSLTGSSSRTWCLTALGGAVATMAAAAAMHHGRRTMSGSSGALRKWDGRCAVSRTRLHASSIGTSAVTRRASQCRRTRRIPRCSRGSRRLC